MKFFVKQDQYDRFFFTDGDGRIDFVHNLSGSWIGRRLSDLAEYYHNKGITVERHVLLPVVGRTLPPAPPMLTRRITKGGFEFTDYDNI